MVSRSRVARCAEGLGLPREHLRSPRWLRAPTGGAIPFPILAAAPHRASAGQLLDHHDDRSHGGRSLPGPMSVIQLSAQTAPHSMDRDHRMPRWFISLRAMDGYDTSRGAGDQTL